MNTDQIELCRKMLKHGSDSYKIRSIYLLSGIADRLCEQDVIEIYNLITDENVGSCALEMIGCFSSFLNLGQKEKILDMIDPDNDSRQDEAMKNVKYLYRDLHDRHVEFIYRHIKSYNENCDKGDFSCKNSSSICDAIMASSYIVHRLSMAHLRAIIACPYIYRSFTTPLYPYRIKKFAPRMSADDCDMICDYMKKGPPVTNRYSTYAYPYIAMLNPKTMTKSCVINLQHMITNGLDASYQAYGLLKEVHNIGRGYLLK